MVGIDKREDGYRIRLVGMLAKDSQLKVTKDNLVIKIKGHPEHTVRVPCTFVAEKAGEKRVGRSRVKPKPSRTPKPPKPTEDTAGTEAVATPAVQEQVVE